MDERRRGVGGWREWYGPAVLSAARPHRETRESRVRSEIDTQQTDGLPAAALPRALGRHAWLVGLAAAVTSAGSVVLSVAVDPHRPMYEIAQPRWQYAVAGLLLGLALDALAALLWDAYERRQVARS